MSKTVLAIAAVSLILSPGAMAQERATARACAADVKAQCAGVKPGEGRLRACVEEHFQELSGSCQRSLFNAGVAIKKACAADTKQFCADVKPGRGRLATCMRPHLAELSQPCKDALAQVAVGKN